MMPTGGMAFEQDWGTYCTTGFEKYKTTCAVRIVKIYDMPIGKIRIGISNGHMPGNKLTFPMEYRLKSRLHYYSRLFNTIEVNSCFYKTPLRSTYEKWVNDVPDDFQFTLKLSRDITHAKELGADLTCMDNFLQAAAGTGNKKGCLLVQFPGKISLDHFNQVELILRQLWSHDTAKEWRIAIEFRNESWYIGETTELLNEYRAAMVLHDFSKAKISVITGKADFCYIRFHGPTGNYRDSYSNHALDEKAQLIREFVIPGKDVYAYFNNTAGNAFVNARYLQSKFM
ncbi:MAG TPA: DUF72 domain-containing protein [Chitinophagaceae bacterium]|jgi:uncharacterized protein YecE (DUF72 family)|nr:DUF72 domain-containing protein [Chitinophagaceae bacterium]